MWNLQIWAWCLIFLGILLIGVLIGFIVCRKITSNYLEKNPPVNEKMIRVMFQQMGRTPSEKQVRQVMSAMNQQKNS